MNWHIINAFSAGIFSLLLGLLVYLKNKRDLTLSFFLMNISISIWNFADILIILSPNNTFALFADRIANIGAFFIIPFFIKTNLIVTESYSYNIYKKLFRFTLLFSVFLSIVNFTKYFLKSVTINPFHEEIGPLYYLFIAYFVIFSFFILYNLLKYYLKIKSPIKKLQLKYIFSGFYFGIIGVFIYFATLINRNIPPLHYIFEIIYLSIFAYAIVKHRLMDIKIIYTRAGIFLIVYSTILGLPFLVGYFTENWIYPTLLMAVLATIGPVIYSKIKQGAEAILLQEEKRAHEMLFKAAEGTTEVRDLKKFLSFTVHIVNRYMNLTNNSVYLFDNEANQYVQKDIRFKSKDENYKPPVFDIDDELIKCLKKVKVPIVYEELILHPLFDKDGIDSASLTSQIKELSAAVIVPGFNKDILMGFLVLGNKKSGNPYTQDDLTFLMVLVRQTTLAIENAIFYEETGKSLAEQFQEHRLRSLGKMGSGMAHQINNRFNLVATTAELAHLEYIPQLKNELIKRNLLEDKLIKTIVEKLHDYLYSIKIEAHKGGDIARALTSFSRKTEGYNSAIIFDDIIKGCLNLLSCKFDLNELGLCYELSKQDYKIEGNLAQLQDVIFNLLDNAHDAHTKIKQEQELGKIKLAADYKPKTTIKTKVINGFFKIEIEDNGIGMMPAQIDQLFIPFFTTKATVMKGTGLGLYIIKKIIESHRNGKIEAKSEYGQGTTFSIQLPVYQDNNKKMEELVTKQSR